MSGKIKFKNILFLLISFLLFFFIQSFFSTDAHAATFNVTNNNDTGAGSLRQAITDANNTPGSDSINFAIGTGQSTITLTTQLPTITEDLTIDATTQPGYSGAPLIVLNGNSFVLNGFTVQNSPATIIGFVIQNFTGSGIDLVSSSSSIIRNNRIGTTPDGLTAAGNNDGINCNGGGNHTIGGPNTTEGNLISGNGNLAIDLINECNGNSIQNNIIGTNITGNLPLANITGGIRIGESTFIGDLVNSRSNNNIIDTNLISGNDGDGILVTGNSENNEIIGNYIGLDVNGNFLVENTSSPQLTVAGGINTMIGGNQPGDRNVISVGDGNTIRILNNSTGGYIKGNYIGTDATGSIALGTPDATFPSLLIQGNSSNIEVGGTTSGDRNVISGNGSTGLHLSDVNNVTVKGNYIGLNAAGTAALPNDGVGLIINFNANNNTIGGPNPEDRNIISGNNTSGVYLYLNSFDNIIEGNYIGTTVDGTGAIGNSSSGIFMSPSTGNTIKDNLISGNGGNGVSMQNSSNDNIVIGNVIGLDVTETVVLPNGFRGVRVNDSTGIQIGGQNPGEGNLISGNATTGVSIQNSGQAYSFQNRIFNNDQDGNGWIEFDIETTPNDFWGNGFNDNLDPDVGPNNLQNSPIVNGATGNQINFSLNSEANSRYTIEFYGFNSLDYRGTGQAEAFLGSVEIDTDSDGNYYGWQNAINPTSYTYLTASATKMEDVLGTFVPTETSEFATPFQVITPPCSNTLYTQSNPTFNWIESNDGTDLNIFDEQVEEVALPFSFSYFGQAFNTINIHDNGMTDFVNGNIYPYYIPSQLPHPGEPNGVIAPFWTDLDATAGAVYTKTIGTAPNRQFIVQWDGVEVYGTADLHTFQMILTETENSILFQYQSMTSTGDIATIGIESRDGFCGIQSGLLENNIAQNNTAILFELTTPLISNTDCSFNTINEDSKTQTNLCILQGVQTIYSGDEVLDNDICGVDDISRNITKENILCDTTQNSISLGEIKTASSRTHPKQIINDIIVQDLSGLGQKNYTITAQFSDLADQTSGATIELGSNPDNKTAALDTGTVTGVAIDNPGSGYTTAPDIFITGGGGAGATAEAIINGGSISQIRVTNPGTGYITRPIITISPQLGSASATAQYIGFQSNLDPVTNEPVEKVFIEFDPSVGTLKGLFPNNYSMDNFLTGPRSLVTSDTQQYTIFYSNQPVNEGRFGIDGVEYGIRVPSFTQTGNYTGTIVQTIIN